MLDLELARQIAVNSGDIQSTMESLIEEIERVRDNPPPEVDLAQQYPALDLLFEASAQFRMYQGQHEGKSMDTKKTEDERQQHRAKADINRLIADRIDALLLVNGSPHGWVFYGPDGEYHWSMAKPDHPEIEDPRPATSLERGILGLIGGNTGGTREFNDWKNSPAAGQPSYHVLAMRTAAGPDVFHMPPDAQVAAEVQHHFVVDCIGFLVAAARLDDWKSRFFYGKPKYGRAGLDSGWQKDFPDFYELAAFAGSFDNIKNPQFTHAILGIATEGAELVEGLVKLMSGFDVDTAKNVIRETGDVDWFQELLAEATGVPVETSRTENIARLAKRFPDKFSELAALARADEQIEHSGYAEVVEDAVFTEVPGAELGGRNKLGDEI